MLDLELAPVDPAKFDSALKVLEEAGRRIKSGETDSLVDLMTFMFSINGAPMTLDRHYPMRDFFSSTMAWKELTMSGRQIGKTTVVIAARSTLLAWLQKRLRILYVLPLQEMAKRVSSFNVRPMIVESPLRNLMVDADCEQNVFVRSFRNGSVMMFSYAFTDCDRIRGISADILNYDEIQDIDYSFLPIIGQTISASKAFKITRYTGTPKSFDNTIQALWEDTSQGEWCIRCGCGHWNHPSLEFDLLNMIGPVSNIAKYGTGLICGKCGKPIDGRQGAWVHAHEDRLVEFLGRHIPQIIIPDRYTDERAWVDIHNAARKDKRTFYNEVLGVSCDVGFKLVTQDELKAACCLSHHNRLAEAVKIVRTQYLQLIMGIDWGGGGEEETSYTTVAIVGARANGKYDTLYLERMSMLSGDFEEARRVAELFKMFGCHYLAHDYTGAGRERETILLQAGFPEDRVLPFSYVRATSKPIISYHPSEHGSRTYYSLDKTRSLLLMCAQIRLGLCFFPEYDSVKSEIADILHLVKETHEFKDLSPITVVTRQPKQSDDIAHAVNFALCGHYQTQQRYPDLSVGLYTGLQPEDAARIEIKPEDFPAIPTSMQARDTFPFA